MPLLYLLSPTWASPFSKALPFRSQCQLLLVFTLPINTISSRYTCWWIDHSKAASGLCPVRSRQAASFHILCLQNTTALAALAHPLIITERIPALVHGSQQNQLWAHLQPTFPGHCWAAVQVWHFCCPRQHSWSVYLCFISKSVSLTFPLHFLSPSARP